MTLGVPDSMTATHELVVPKSIPMILHTRKVRDSGPGIAVERGCGARDLLGEASLGSGDSAVVVSEHSAGETRFVS